MSRIIRRSDLMDIYDRLLKRYGARGWWPMHAGGWADGHYHPGKRNIHPPSDDHSPHFEMMAGAILTQNTAWRNVSAVIKTLFDNTCLTPRAMAAIPLDELKAMIRPAGYFNQKADRLKILANHVIKRYGGDAERMAKTIHRADLLAIKGVGPETADSILLYAGNRPFFVIDTYTKRLLKTLGVIYNQYDEYRTFFESRLEPDAALFNEFHALIVAWGADKRTEI